MLNGAGFIDSVPVVDNDDVPVDEMDMLDRRIAAALQVDGRASWRQIAEVLDEPVRVVSRRANALLAAQTVRVTAVLDLVHWHLATLTCAPKAADAVARAVAGRGDVNMVYTLAHGGLVLAETRVERGSTVTNLWTELGAIDGVEQVTLEPILRYFRTIDDWRPAILTPDEIARLEVPVDPVSSQQPHEPLDEVNAAIAEALISDGRRPYDALGALVGISEPTARRRVESLRQRGVLRIRALVSPQALGLPVETMIWVDCPPAQASAVGASIAALPQVAYAVLTLGSSAVVAYLACVDHRQLRNVLTDSPWGAHVTRIRSTTVLRAFKRSGLLL